MGINCTTLLSQTIESAYLYFNHIYCCFARLDPTDLTVTIESNVTVNEDVGSVQLCVNLDDLPAGGMQISVEVFLAATENSAGRRIK